MSGITSDTQRSDGAVGPRRDETALAPSDGATLETKDCEPASGADDGAADPRLRPACIERVAAGPGTVVLVGVLHDHPASTHRVQTVIEAAGPDVLALELPPLAVPLAVQQAADGRTPPALGGEMSAAVQAADTDRVVGIDGPSVGFLRSLAGELRAAAASPATVGKTLRNLRSVAVRAVGRRVAAGVAAHTVLSVAVDPPAVYDTGHDDAPDRQAADERDRMAAAEALLCAVTPPPAAAVTRTARERHMAARLASLSGTGDVVAVVGQAHLAAVAGRLRDRA